jgi:hypothetical protein
MMFQIRNQQIDALQADMLRRFEDAAIEHLRLHLTSQAQSYTDDELRQRVRECTIRAELYGLTSEQEIMCFVDATYLLGDRFDSDPSIPWAKELLEDQDLKPPDKAETLLEWASEADLEELEQEE